MYCPPVRAHVADFHQLEEMLFIAIKALILPIFQGHVYESEYTDEDFGGKVGRYHVVTACQSSVLQVPSVNLLIDRALSTPYNSHCGGISGPAAIEVSDYASENERVILSTGKQRMNQRYARNIVQVT